MATGFRAIVLAGLAIGSVGGVVETIAFDGFGDFPHGFSGLMDEPAVERLLRALWIEADSARRPIEFDETRRIPELGREIAVTLDVLRRKLDVVTLRGGLARYRIGDRDYHAHCFDISLVGPLSPPPSL